MCFWEGEDEDTGGEAGEEIVDVDVVLSPGSLFVRVSFPQLILHFRLLNSFNRLSLCIIHLLVHLWPIVHERPVDDLRDHQKIRILSGAGEGAAGATLLQK